jgi:hypothetical protein
MEGCQGNHNDVASYNPGKIRRLEHSYWFDAECEHVTMIKHEAYTRMQKRNHTGKAVEEQRVARKEGKKVYEKGRL